MSILEIFSNVSPAQTYVRNTPFDDDSPLRTCWNISSGFESVHCLGYLYFRMTHLCQDVKVETLNAHLCFHCILYVFFHYFMLTDKLKSFLAQIFPTMYLRVFNVGTAVAVLQSLGDSSCIWYCKCQNISRNISRYSISCFFTIPGCK